MQTRRQYEPGHHRRRGWLAPIIALLLVVVLGGIALVLDRLWLDMATSEAQTVADIAALAAARELASDDDLRDPAPADEGRIAAATVAAENAASLNQVAGRPYSLDPANGDLRFGLKLQVEETGEVRFVETTHQPRTARAISQRTHVRGNPVGLFFAGLTRITAGEVRATAEATIDNHVIGFQCVGDAHVPMLPLAILAKDPSGQRKDTWQVQIEQRQGLDEYSFDASNGKIDAGGDGIPEIILKSAAPGADASSSNMTLVDVHGQVGHFPLADQIRFGWSPQDLERRDARFTPKSGEGFMGRSTVSKGTSNALRSILGECRGVLLYQSAVQSADKNSVQIQSTGLVAGRVMAVRESGGEIQLVFQPGVLASRTAVRPADLGMAGVETAANPYIYQLKLTQ